MLTEDSMSRKDQPQRSGDLLWGAEAIAHHIDRSVRQTYYLIERQRIPVTKLGHKTIVASRAELDAHLKSETST
jgi:hypothetical protein